MRFWRRGRGCYGTFVRRPGRRGLSLSLSSGALLILLAGSFLGLLNRPLKAAQDLAVFGTGRDGDLVVGPGQTVYLNGLYQSNGYMTLSGDAPSGQRTIPVYDTYVAAGDEVLVIQMQGSGAGLYEFGIIESPGRGSPTALTLRDNLVNSYTTAGNSRAQVVKVPHLRNVTVQNGGTLRALEWQRGAVERLQGLIVFRASGTVTVEFGGSITANQLGFRGGTGSPNKNEPGDVGESYVANLPPTSAWLPNGAPNAGGGGTPNGPPCGGSPGKGAGGGGGYGTAGAAGGSQSGGCPAQGGQTYGSASLKERIYHGSGGGGPSNDGPMGYGGHGGGMIMIFARTLIVAGSVTANGGKGTVAGSGNETVTGGGGLGGPSSSPARTPRWGTAWLGPRAEAPTLPPGREASEAMGGSTSSISPSPGLPIPRPRPSLCNSIGRPWP